MRVQYRACILSQVQCRFHLLSPSDALNNERHVPLSFFLISRFFFISLENTRLFCEGKIDKCKRTDSLMVLLRFSRNAQRARMRIA